MRPWQGTQAVWVLDDRLATCGLVPGTAGV
jgi:hypothetical protein